MFGKKGGVKPLSARRLQARDDWQAGVLALNTGDRATAEKSFVAATRRDDDMADAWLGLHAVGDEPDRALFRLQCCVERFGEETARTGLSLESTFEIGPYGFCVLKSRHDLWCAVAADYLERGMISHAGRALGGHYGSVAPLYESADDWFDDAIFCADPMGAYLMGRMAISRADPQRAIRWLTIAAGLDSPLRWAARLMRGGLYQDAGRTDLAVADFAFIASDDAADPDVRSEALTRLDELEQT